MFESIAKAGISHVIQLSVAPVFLLTGVAGILNVMSNRLSRIVDRARVLELKLEGAGEALHAEVAASLGRLSHRARLIARAIALCVVTAVLVCAVIITLFFGEFSELNTGVPAALLFIGALLSFLFALLFLLREILLATDTLKFGPG